MIALEHISPEDWNAVDRMRQTLNALVLDTGGRSVGIRFGVGTATWTASAFSAAVVIPHGLGRAPVVAFAGSQNALNGYSVSGVGATNMSVTGFRTDNVSVTGSAGFFWVVFG